MMLRPQGTRNTVDYAQLSTKGQGNNEPKSVPVKNFVKNYVIRREKALGKKLSASDRPDMLTIKQTGGGAFILCQLGYYECLR